VTATGLLRHAGRVAGVVARGHNGSELRLGGNVVIGADGVRSMVAQAAGASVERRASTSGAVLYRYYADLPVAGYEWAYGDEAAAGMIPTNDGLTCAFVSTSPERMRSLRRLGAEPAFVALLAAATPAQAARVHHASPVGRMHGWSTVAGFSRRSWGRGWALVGDAGYFKDPISAHGMTDAMRDAELLANALLRGWSGAVPELVGLAQYQTQRDRLSASLFEATGRLAAYDWDQPAVEAILRQVSAAMTDEVELLEGLATPPQSSGTDSVERADTLAAQR